MISTPLSRYFASIGFRVEWAQKRAVGECWFEIFDGATLLCQVSFDAPLDEFLTDLPHYARGTQKGVGPTDYWVRTEDPRVYQKLLDRVCVLDPARWRQIDREATSAQQPVVDRSAEWQCGFAAAIAEVLRLDGSARMVRGMIEDNGMSVEALISHAEKGDANTLRVAFSKGAEVVR